MICGARGSDILRLALYLWVLKVIYKNMLLLKKMRARPFPVCGTLSRLHAWAISNVEVRVGANQARPRVPQMTLCRGFSSLKGSL